MRPPYRGGPIRPRPRGCPLACRPIEGARDTEGIEASAGRVDDPGATGRLDRSGRIVIGATFLGTGFAALVLQVTWQRVIALHSGVDLSSSVIVVTAFLTGLGIGNLLGGRLADRLDRVGALRVLALADLGVAVYAGASTWLLYDLYRSIAGSLEAAPARFAFNLALVLLPTVLQGLSLPLIARAVVDDAGSAGSLLGRFNALNTIGASLGAAIGGWVLLGSLGFRATTQVAALVYVSTSVLVGGLAIAPRLSDRTRRILAGIAGTLIALVGAALVVGVLGPRRIVSVARWPIALGTFAGLFALAWSAITRDHLRPDGPVASVAPEAPAAPVDDPEVDPEPSGAPAPAGRTWVWIALYGVTGGVALGFELVFFRLIDSVMRSNTYTFSHVLSIYLGLLGAGVALGSWLAPRVVDRRRGFLWAQFTAGIGALASVVVGLRILPSTLLQGPADRWFSSDGFAAGFGQASLGDSILFGAVIPVLLMAVPVLATGASYPFVQGLVTRDVQTVGTQTGRLTAANLLGNVIGSTLTGFVLIEHVGTAGAYRILFVPLFVIGVVAALLAPRPTVRWVQAAAVVIVSAVLFTALPTNLRLWAILHHTGQDSILLAEDRSCGSVVKVYGDDELQLTLNGAGQNGHPFDDFHVLIGLLPSLAQPDPERGLAIGLGIGSTSDAMLVSGRVQKVTSVELCGGNYELVDRLAERGIEDFVRLRDDPRHEQVIGDGRRHLLTTDRTYDIVVPDTVRPNSASSGNLYSKEFQDLVDGSLSDDGITAGWVPSIRALNAVSTTYPYVAVIDVPTYNGSQFYLASRSPLPLDPDVLVERFDAHAAADLPPDQARRLRRDLQELDPICVNDGQVAPAPPPVAENRDLRPRDEYVLTNPTPLDDETSRTCGP